MSEPIDEVAGAHFAFFRFGIADEVDVGDDDDVGTLETGGELVEKKAGSAVLMGLEDADESAGRFFVGAKGAEGGVDFGGVVPVVVVDGDVSARHVSFAEFLHPSIDTREEFERACDSVPFEYAELMRKHRSSGGVHGHVFAGDG